MTAPAPWAAWAPPLDPPTAGGLDAAVAQGIADATGYPADPHLTAALQWEAYAFSLPPTPSVSAVSTGAQTVTYNPAQPVGDFGLAMGQAQRHWAARGDLVSVPLQRDYYPATQPLADMGWWIDP